VKLGSAAGVGAAGVGGAGIGAAGGVTGDWVTAASVEPGARTSVDAPGRGASWRGRS
jgi:hypothetical protein